MSMVGVFALRLFARGDGHLHRGCDQFGDDERERLSLRLVAVFAVDDCCCDPRLARDCVAELLVKGRGCDDAPGSDGLILTDPVDAVDRLILR